MSADVPPNQTIYVNNLYEKLTKDGNTYVAVLEKACATSLLTLSICCRVAEEFVCRVWAVRQNP